MGAAPRNQPLPGGSLIPGGEDVLEARLQFQDKTREWRRLIAEFVGTFFLVLVAAGAPMMSVYAQGSVSRASAVVAPGLMVMAVIMAMGKVSGAHLNPAVSLAFATRGDFPWPRVPGYIAVQLAGAWTAAVLLQAMLGVSASHGSTYPGAHATALSAAIMEAVLTFGLVTVILGTASGAQNIGVIGSVGVGAYIALAGLWASPVSGASMNPARTFGPNLASLNFTSYWAYVVGPLAGAALAVVVGNLLRGSGGSKTARHTAQGKGN